MRTYVSTLTKVTTCANTIYRQINHKNHSSLSLELYLRVMDARVLLLNNKLIVKIYIWFGPYTLTQAAFKYEVKNTYTWRTACQLIEITENLWNSIWRIHFEMSVCLRRSRALALTVQVFISRDTCTASTSNNVYWWHIFGAVTLKLDEIIFVNISINDNSSTALGFDKITCWMIQWMSVNSNENTKGIFQWNHTKVAETEGSGIGGFISSGSFSCFSKVETCNSQLFAELKIQFELCLGKTMFGKQFILIVHTTISYLLCLDFQRVETIKISIHQI